MSEQQTFIGTIQKTCFTPEQAVEAVLARTKGAAEYLEKALAYSDTKEEAYRDLFCHTGTFIMVDGKAGTEVWSTDLHEQGNDFLFAHKRSNGQILIATSFYNGGTCLEELLTDYIRKES